MTISKDPSVSTTTFIENMTWSPSNMYVGPVKKNLIFVSLKPALVIKLKTDELFVSPYYVSER